jgi:hypothetical protein
MKDGEQPIDPPPVELQELARDWITLWQSELAALATDREAQETWQTLMALWAGAAGAMLQALPRAGHDGGGARSSYAPRPAAAPAAPDPRDAEIERLARRVAELERRLAELERGGDGKGAGDRGRAGGTRRRVP